MPDKLPDASGHFGVYGGRFVAETLIEPLEELTRAYRKYNRRQGVPGGIRP